MKAGRRARAEKKEKRERDTGAPKNDSVFGANRCRSSRGEKISLQFTQLDYVPIYRKFPMFSFATQNHLLQIRHAEVIKNNSFVKSIVCASSAAEVPTAPHFILTTKV